MRHRIFQTLVPILVASAFSAAAESPVVLKARDVAAAWLALADQGAYDRTWDEAAAFFKSAISKSQWVNALGAVRAPLGAVKSRTFKSAETARSLPGAPDGEYVVLRFETQFENKAAALETITPMREKDGSWRVSGYFIK